MILEKFTIFLTIYFIADALHDTYFLGARPTIYDRTKDKIWHIIDSGIKGGIAAYILYLYGITSICQMGLYAIYFMAHRALIFNLAINLFRKNVDIFHLSNNGIEGFIKNMFNITAYWLMSVFTILLIYTIIKMLNYG